MQLNANALYDLTMIELVSSYIKPEVKAQLISATPSTKQLPNLIVVSDNRLELGAPSRKTFDVSLNLDSTTLFLRIHPPTFDSLSRNLQEFFQESSSRITSIDDLNAFLSNEIPNTSSAASSRLVDLLVPYTDPLASNISQALSFFTSKFKDKPLSKVEADPRESFISRHAFSLTILGGGALLLGLSKRFR